MHTANESDEHTAIRFTGFAGFLDNIVSNCCHVKLTILNCHETLSCRNFILSRSLNSPPLNFRHVNPPVHFSHVKLSTLNSRYTKAIRYSAVYIANFIRRCQCSACTQKNCLFYFSFSFLIPQFLSSRIIARLTKGGSQ